MRERMRTHWHQGLIVLLAIALSGCAMGPRVLRSNRPAYNRAVQQSVSEELLLNIVRARYAEPITFLQLGSIIASFSVGAGINGNATIPINEPAQANDPNILNFGADLSYGESPTLTLTPVEGEAFVKQMLTEAPIDTMLRIMRSGWSIGTVMRIMVSRIGPLSADFGSTNIEKYLELLELWSKVQSRGGFSLEQVPDQNSPVTEFSAKQIYPSLYIFVEKQGYMISPTQNGKFQLSREGGVTLVVRTTYTNAAEADKVDALLGFKAARIAAPGGRVITRIALTNALAPSPVLYDKSVTEVKLVMRSILEQLFLLSQGIELPASEQNKALTVGDAASLKEVLNIQVSDARPDNAYLAVRYRGLWFSVSDQDVMSKDAFQLLTLVFALQTAGGGAGPNLTLPVGG